MRQKPWPTAMAMVIAGLCLGACSGAGREAAPVAGATPGTPATSATPVAAREVASGTVPAAAAEGRPAATAAPPRAAVPDDSAAELRGEIVRLIGSAACRDDSQCRALPLGSKPCGGPEGYVAWSTAQTDARLLEALASRYKDARQARNQRLGLMSDCAVVPEPPVRCVPVADATAAGGRCQALASRGGPGPALR
jgi:hypothetical protein